MTINTRAWRTNERRYLLQAELSELSRYCVEPTNSHGFRYRLRLLRYAQSPSQLPACLVSPCLRTDQLPLLPLPPPGDDEAVADLKARVKNYDVAAWWTLNAQVQMPMKLQALQKASGATTMDPMDIDTPSTGTATTDLHNPYAGKPVSIISKVLIYPFISVLPSPEHHFLTYEAISPSW